MKILITGANGMLAKEIKNEFKNNELICTDVDELDITNIENVQAYVKKVNPEIIINCAAYTAVDKAEDDKELARKVNAVGPKNLAKVSKENNIILVHISTDYVFGGNKPLNEFYKEDDEKSPNTVYGATKLEGENEIEKNCDKYYIFRTAWLFGDGKNFVRTMIKLGNEKEEINVVSDQHGSPTYTVDLAKVIYESIKKQIPYGIYNVTNEGYTTWYEFAKEIFKLANINCKVNSVKSEEFESKAHRPKNSKLSKEKILSEGISLPSYEDALKRYLKKECRK